jgi:phenylpyruvate tautomerase PptA (4-oxalocrotonate tautomerase family)
MLDEEAVSSEAGMPTYVCWTRAGQLSLDQRQRVAKSITEIHHDLTFTPRFLVQVIFNELQPHSHYIGGAEAEPNHIWIRADIRSGRTQEQKSRLLMRIVDDVCAISDAPRENIWVCISDIPVINIIEYGHILPQSGEEDAWFAKLPHDLQERLRSRA